MSPPIPDTPSGKDPRYTLIVVGDDGRYYKITRDQWMVEENVLNDVEEGVVAQLTKWGSYLSYIPPKLAVGVGSVCTVLNLQSILANRKSDDS